MEYLPAAPFFNFKLQLHLFTIKYRPLKPFHPVQGFLHAFSPLKKLFTIGLMSPLIKALYCFLHLFNFLLLVFICMPQLFITSFSLFQIVGIGSMIDFISTVFYFHNPAYNLIQEITVMRDNYNCACIIL